MDATDCPRTDRRRRAAALALLGLLLAAVATRGEEAVHGPGPEQLCAVTQLQRRLRTRVEVRWDPATGGPCQVACRPPVPLTGQAPETAARDAIRRLEPLWGRLPLDEQTARRGPHLVLTGARQAGPLRVVAFQQMLGPAAVDGSELQVTLARLRGRVVLLRVAGRAWRDVPWTTPLLPAGRVPAGARQVVVRHEGRWQALLHTREVDRAGFAEDVLRRPDGQVVLRRARRFSGRAVAAVSGGLGPLADVYVEVGGQRLTTDARGVFPGQTGALTWGLEGPYLRVLPATTAPWPTTSNGLLRVDSARDGAREEELRLWQSLLATRAFYATIDGLGPAELDTPLVARVGDGMINAFAAWDPVTMDGREYTSLMAFGRGLALDQSVVSHERGHVLLRQLGFHPTGGDEARALHEGISDYLAAAQSGSTLIGAEGLGHYRRDIDDDLTYPLDATSDPHRTGAIFAAALWDGRRAAGAEAGALDAAVVRMVRQLSGSSKLTDAARLLLAELSPGSLHDAVEQELLRHGLLPAPGALIELHVRTPRAVEAGGPAEVEAGQTLTLELGALERSGSTTLPVDLLLDGPEWATAQGSDITEQGLHGRRLDVTLAPPPGTSGSFLLTVTAQSRRGEATTTRTIPVRVQDTPAPDESRTLPPVTWEVRVGEHRTEDLPPLFPGMPGGARYRICGSDTRSSDPYQLRGVTSVSDAMSIVGDRLHMQPEPGEEGAHLFWVMAEPAGPRDVVRSRSRQVRVLVTGVDPGFIVVTSRRPIMGGRSDREDLVTPGGQLSVERGRSLDLSLLGWSDLPGTLALTPGDWGGTSVTLQGGNTSVPAGSQGSSALESALVPAHGRISQGSLSIQPERVGPPERLEVTIELRGSGGEQLATRTLVILILPAKAEDPVQAQAPGGSLGQDRPGPGETPPGQAPPGSGPSGQPGSLGFTGALDQASRR